MRIAQLANFVGPSSGGMKTAVEALGAGYVAAGAERLLIIPGPSDAKRSTDSGDVIQLRAPRVGGGYRLIVEPWRVIEALEHFRPSSLEISDKSTLLPVSRWARKKDVQTLLFSHERLDAMIALRMGRTAGIAAPISTLNRVLVRQFDGIVVTSSFARHEFAALAAAAGTPVHQIALGVDLEAFRPSSPARRRGQELRLVHVGRLSREKSPHLAVATAVALHRRGVPMRLDVYGEGPHRSELEDLAADAPVTFHGHISGRRRLGDLIGRADVALSVCPGETFGLAVLEALACGTPVVTANVGGARELVDEWSGAWAEPDQEALADAVLRLAEVPPGVRRSGARGRAEQYSWDRTVAAMLELHQGSADCLRQPAEHSA